MPSAPCKQRSPPRKPRLQRPTGPRSPATPSWNASWGLVPEIDLLIRGLDAQAAALETYSVTVDELQGEQRLLAARRTTADSDLSDLQFGKTDFTTPGDTFIFMPTDVRQTRQEEAFETTYAQIAAIDVLWDELATRRRTADATCVRDLGSDQVLGATAWFGTNAAVRGSVDDLIARMNTLSEADLAVLIATNSDLVKRMLTATPETVPERWQQLGEPAQLALIAGAPVLLGSLNGLPALARVAANRLNASTRITEIDAESAKLDAENAGMDRTRGRWEQSYGRSDQIAKELEQLEDERSYLQRTVDGKNQLYLYDHEGARIIEMRGTPSSETRQRISYVPGTMSNMDMFYDGSVQTVSQWFVDNHPDTVAFIYKDDLFPGDSDGTRGGLAKGIPDANSADFAEQTGPFLAAFETGLATDPLFAAATSTAIGHSWGLANITSAEVSGAHYDSVVSLSGAWMPKDWTADSTTTYADFSYEDILQVAQGTGGVGDGNNPRSSDAFDSGPYYEGPKWYPTVMVDNHSLVATDDPRNNKVLRDLEKWMYK
ncbi:hypothetical protein SAMN05216368_105125 [Cryobacterium flavum]|uniref:Alpha/beta hydrolase n=1 Tax=Cryobacterium flavum TaxID=1424659 RepID=A0A4R8VFN9_9MICO|nr:hypothetical protein [Cryobacterium flavum]TFB81959.1 hypothetical protein E3O21_01430 [Cryobacterium flavum]SDN39169.1 hypothetical protein SAMN05216368_105125 [Cryobacterium flavum]